MENEVQCKSNEFKTNLKEAESENLPNNQKKTELSHKEILSNQKSNQQLNQQSPFNRKKDRNERNIKRQENNAIKPKKIR